MLDHTQFEQIRSTWVEIDLDAVTHNFRNLETWLPEGVKTLVVLKANAYGHGATILAKEYSSLGADMIGVAVLEEGIELRESGIQTPILVLGPSNPVQTDAILHYNLQQTVFTREMADALNASARKKGIRAVVHVKVDTGMGRLGINFADAVSFIHSIQKMDSIVLEGVMTSFSTADEQDDGFLNLQIQRFKRVLDELRLEGIRIPLVHAANSAALMREHEALFNMARPGIMIYGISPIPQSMSLHPVLSMKTRIADLRDVPAGTPISYGRTYMTPYQSRIATIPVGYDDGYMRALSNRAQVLVHGIRVNIVGNICMDMCMIDVTPLKHVTIQDEVVLIGTQGSGTITCSELAAIAGTIPYEFVCRIGRRVPRIYIRNGKIVAVHSMQGMAFADIS